MKALFWFPIFFALWVGASFAQTQADSYQIGFMSAPGVNGCPSSSACFTAYGSTVPTTSGSGTPVAYITQSTVENVQIGYMSPAGQNGCPVTNACFVAYGATIPTSGGGSGITWPTVGDIVISPGASGNPTGIVPGTGITSALASALNGTGAFAGTTSPTFVTPTLGAALATSINGLTITSSTGTLTIPNGITLNAGAGGTLGALAFVTPGTGIATALGINVGSVGAPVLFNGAGGTPSSLTLTSATGLPAAGVVHTALTSSDAAQTMSGGFAFTEFSNGTVSSGTKTIDCRNAPLQTLTNNGAFTLDMNTTSSQNCRVIVLNGASAGAITFASGFSEGSNTGDALDTTNGHKFSIVLDYSVFITAKHYLVSAYQ
jgi:hypothetical protein